MANSTIKVKVFRYDPAVDEEPYYRSYEVPKEDATTAMEALDYIYRKLDGTLRYYDHAGCTLGICGRCTGVVNGRPGLLCQIQLTGDSTIEPVSKDDVLVDLVPVTSSVPE